VVDSNEVEAEPPGKLVMTVPENRLRITVLRFVLIGSAAGYLIGFFEAALYYFIPFVPSLQVANVGSLIWLTAPLTYAFLFALAGIVLGLPASLISNPTLRSEVSVLLACVLAGLVGGIVAWIPGLIHLWPTDADQFNSLSLAFLCFGLIFSGALLVARRNWGRARQIFETQARWPVSLMKRLIFGTTLVLVAGLAVHWVKRLDLFSPVYAQPASKNLRPNIVLITLDTVRADHVSAYGYHRPTTPYFDRFAQRGVLFEQAVAPSSWTLPSHASIFTGLLPHQHGAGPYDPLDNRPRTLAEILSSVGYETAGFSSNSGYGLSIWGLGRGFQLYEDDRVLPSHNFTYTAAGRALSQSQYLRFERPDLLYVRSAQDLNEQILRWYRHRSGRPFFLFINYMDAHDPYHVPPGFEPKFGEMSAELLSQLAETNAPLFSSKERESMVAGYDNGLAYLDAQVGYLLDVLDSASEGSNTYVILTSDHGESFGEHGTYLHGHALYYHELLHVPLAIAGPNIPSDVRVEHPVRLRELFATVLEMALGERLPVRQYSLGRFWSAGYAPIERDEGIISELSPASMLIQPESMSFINSDLQYLRNSVGKVELYNWKADPEESTNLVLAQENQRILTSLQENLEERIQFSFRPWLAPGYLLPLNPTNPFSLASSASRPPRPSGALPNVLRVGTVQNLFPPNSAVRTVRPQPANEELLKSLPYK
jgi:arylsulfatase A-like enzyme